jgi:23S rRNA (guanine745-N1)-methyltransferase
VVVLLCPVRACRLPLTSRGRRLACRRGHSFDIARRGYVNLLQVQDRRSRRPGDSVAATDARQRLRARGIEAPLIDAMTDLLTLAPTDAILEVGCGEGDHLAAIAARFGCEGHGVDISVASIEAAAQRHPRLHWVVANADRLLPYADASFRVVASITARRNAVEFRRVLREDGTLLVVVPAPDDLIELREAVLGEGRARDRVEPARAALAPYFALERHERLRHVARLDPAAIRDVMTASYRALRASQRERLAALGELAVTLSRDALLLRPASRPERQRIRALPGAAVRRRRP